jgi:hypothetical protein
LRRALKTYPEIGRVVSSISLGAWWEAIPQIGDHDTAVLMHNDGVAQGLSEVPFMQDVDHWGVLTIGTGLGNARFTNRRSKSRDKGEGKGKKKAKKAEIS